MPFFWIDHFFLQQQTTTTTVGGANLDYTTTLTVDEALASQSELTFRINLTDAAGNEGFISTAENDLPILGFTWLDFFFVVIFVFFQANSTKKTPVQIQKVSKIRLFFCNQLYFRRCISVCPRIMDINQQWSTRGQLGIELISLFRVQNYWAKIQLPRFLEFLLTWLQLVFFFSFFLVFPSFPQSILLVFVLFFPGPKLCLIFW